MLSAAALVDWVGVGNLNSPNDYVVTSATTAGGTFAERRAVAASLSDHSLMNGPFDWNSQLSMAGTVEFSGGYDPVLFIGWFDSTNPNERIGIGAANPEPAGTGIRWQTQSGNAAGTGVVSQDFNASRSISTFAPGTYDFVFNYDGAGHMAGTFGGLNFARNYALPTNVDLNMDRFGFLQKSSVDDNVHTITVHISEINYTGETQYTPPGPMLPGDYNGDNSVNAADYVLWRKHLGSSFELPGDTTPPDVTSEDYGVWQANFGNVLSTPAAPSGLGATSSAGEISLEWTDHADNETGFVVERRVGSSGAFTEVVTLPANATSYVDTGLTANVTYQYQVRTVNDAGQSSPSNLASATTPQVTISAVNYSRTQIYHGSQAENYQSGDPSWTSWVGAWIMPNGDLMVGFTQASGREQPFHDNPSPYNYSQLDIDVVYLRSSDGGANWTKVVESDVSFTTADDSGKGTHANSSPATIALNDGSLLRRVYGWDYGEFPNMPGTSFMQRSTDGGLTWSPMPVSTDGGQTWSDPSPIQEFLLDPTQYTVQPTRIRRLSDGRLLLAGAVWNGQNTQSAPKEPLMMVSADEGVSWQRINFAGPGWSPTFSSKFSNEWDFAELPNGDLILMSRVQNLPRWQAIMTKAGDTWQVQSAGETSIPHSGHPELLATKEGPILYFATTGALWTNDNGQTWNPLRVDSLPDLAGGDYRSMYYPNSVQTADGWIYVFSHRSSPGGDDNYGGANQHISMDRFRLVVQAVPVAGSGAAQADEATQQYAASEPVLADASPFLLATSPTGRFAAQNSKTAVLASSQAKSNDDAIEQNLLMLNGPTTENEPTPSETAQADAVDAALADDVAWVNWLGGRNKPFSIIDLRGADALPW